MPAKLQCHPSLPEPGEDFASPPPKPRAQALPCRTACSLIYEGQAGTGPSSRRRSQALRKVWGCPDPVPASREPAREGGTAPLQGQTWVSTLMKQQECTSCLPARKTRGEPGSPGTPDGSKDRKSAESQQCQGLRDPQGPASVVALDPISLRPLRPQLTKVPIPATPENC